MRAFIAIELPEEIRNELKQYQQSFRSVCRDARWTRPEGIHLTLKFLGEISEDTSQKVIEALNGLGAIEKFQIEVKGFGFFPDARRPRVFWAGVSAPAALAALAERVDVAMSGVGFEREKRSFNPHLTLARFKQPRPQPGLAAEIDKLGTTVFGRFEASEFFLYESRLLPSGAEYRKVAHFPFGK